MREKGTERIGYARQRRGVKKAGKNIKEGRKMGRGIPVVKNRVKMLK